MARQVTEVVTDDLDGSANAKIVRFAYEGMEYEIDLGPDNRQKLAEFLLPYIDKGRRVSKAPAVSGRKNGRVQTNGNGTVDAKTVRAWALKKGLEVTRRGRVPKDIITLYEKETGVLV